MYQVRDISSIELCPERHLKRIVTLNQKDRVEYLKSHTIFSDLKVKHIEILAKHCKKQTFAVGDLLFKQQDPAETFFILLVGSVQVEVPAIQGPALPVQELGPDEVLGWSWLIPPYRWNFEAKADQDCEVLVFDGKALLAYCEEHNDFGYELIKRFSGLMSQRLQAARIRMMDNWAPAGWA